MAAPSSWVRKEVTRPNKRAHPKVPYTQTTAPTYLPTETQHLSSHTDDSTTKLRTRQTHLRPRHPGHQPSHIPVRNRYAIRLCCRLLRRVSGVVRTRGRICPRKVSQGRGLVWTVSSASRTPNPISRTTSPAGAPLAWRVAILPSSKHLKGQYLRGRRESLMEIIHEISIQKNNDF